MNLNENVKLWLYFWFLLLMKQCYAVLECRITASGWEYQGQTSKTTSGKTCQAWTSQSPHSHSMTANHMFPDGSAAAAQNYCRNPDYDHGGPWCHTTNAGTVKEACDIPLCACRWPVGLNVTNPIPSPFIYHTSSQVSGHGPYNARIDHTSGGWCAQSSDTAPWIDVDFRKNNYAQLSGLAMQPGPSGKYITRFRVGYYQISMYAHIVARSEDPIMVADANGNEIVFQGLTSSDDPPKIFMFPELANCSVLRIFVDGWAGTQACARVEPYGCGGLLGGNVWGKISQTWWQPNIFYTAYYTKLGVQGGPRPDPLWSAKLTTVFDIDRYKCVKSCGDYPQCQWIYYEVLDGRIRCMLLKADPNHI